MKYISTVLSHLRPIQILMSVVLSAVLVFTSSFPALAANSSLSKGTVQLDKIEQKTEQALDDPATTLKTIEERSQGALNEVQGSADRNKMSRSNDKELPVVKQAEKALNKMKNR
jgi:hypothetical protein